MTILDWFYKPKGCDMSTALLQAYYSFKYYLVTRLWPPSTQLLKVLVNTTCSKGGHKVITRWTQVRDYEVIHCISGMVMQISLMLRMGAVVELRTPVLEQVWPVWALVPSTAWSRPHTWSSERSKGYGTPLWRVTERWERGGGEIEREWWEKKGERILIHGWYCIFA